jgi:hypothetical protein
LPFECNLQRYIVGKDYAAKGAVVRAKAAVVKAKAAKKKKNAIKG